MKLAFHFLLILSLTTFGLGVKNDYRILGNLFSGGGLYCIGCAFRKCLKDESVIMGYCCGCARVSDYLPIDCTNLHLNCPTDGRKLCRDYDYMLDCCCP